MTEPVFVFAELNLKNMPFHPITLQFVDRIEMKIMLEQPLRSRGQQTIGAVGSSQTGRTGASSTQNQGSAQVLSGRKRGTAAVARKHP